jgi:hypothetical protein
MMLIFLVPETQSAMKSPETQSTMKSPETQSALGIRHRTETNKAKTTTQGTKKMSIM